MHEVDLEELAEAYHHRAMSEAAIDRARLSCAGLEGLALDVGGGTGRHASVMAACGLRPLVIDASPAMCARAWASGTTAIVGRSEQLPISDRVAALVHFHLSIHYGDWRQAIDEAVRVLAGRGRIDIWTFTPTSVERSALARWFPSVGHIDAQRFPPPSALADRMVDAGLDVVTSAHPEDVERTARAWVTAARSRFVSTLQLIDDEELERGIEAFRRNHPDPSEPYRYVLEYVRISAGR